jgi:hypothetical protein
MMWFWEMCYIPLDNIQGGFSIPCLMFNTTFNNISVISWWSVLLVEETGVPGENHRPVASHWDTFSHNVVSITPRHKLHSNSQGVNCIGSWVVNTTTILANQIISISLSLRDLHTTPFIGGKFYIPELCFRVISVFIISNSFQKLTFTSLPNGTSNDVKKTLNSIYIATLERPIVYFIIYHG